MVSNTLLPRKTFERKIYESKYILDGNDWSSFWDSFTFKRIVKNKAKKINLFMFDGSTTENEFAHELNLIKENYSYEDAAN
jgi:hypothetical protein